MKKTALLISCEHAVDTVPENYTDLFIPFKSLLASHRGIDFGALEIALHLKNTVPCDFVQATSTRLLIDCNRSINHTQCFSEVTRELSLTDKQLIINQFYTPFRNAVIELIKHHIAKGFQVWHLSIHSFTPVMHDTVRNADIGFLYDPRRPAEKNLAKQWQHEIKRVHPEYRIRRNYPYSGTSDGFTTALRKQFDNNDYVGIEIESNQAITTNDHTLSTLKDILSTSLLNLIC